MKTVGIIAEYNPFHNGHLYQIEQAKKMTGADTVVIVMSGNFVQRGAPSVIHKYARTKMALSCGADLVIELPVSYATASAEYFAKGAVALLNQLGVVDYLCFGSECNDIHLLQAIANYLIHSKSAYTEDLQEYLKAGLSYPAAREKAILQAILKSQPELSHKELLNVLASPNNILGIEYCKALLEQKSPIKPVTILRKGAGYHETSLTGHNSSAKAIRNLLQNNSSDSLFLSIKDQIPSQVFDILAACQEKNYPILLDDFSELLHYKLLSEAACGYTAYFDVSKDLSDRICNLLPQFRDFEQFCQLLKTKALTYTRISRCLTHILLNLKKEDMESYLTYGICFYIRILGFKKSSSEILSAIKKNGSLPLITKLADANRILRDTPHSDLAIKMLQEDIDTSHIYYSVSMHKYHCNMMNEYQKSIVLYHE